MSLRRIPITTVALGTVALVLAFLIGRDVFFPPAVNTAATIRTGMVAVGSVRSVVTGTGSLVPMSTMNVGFKTGGTVTEVDAKVGDHVTAGQVLAKVDPATAQVALDQANANLATAQANLSSTLNGNALAQAQHALAQAQQSYNDTATQVATTNQADQNQLSSDQNQYNIDNALLASDSASPYFQNYSATVQNDQTAYNNAVAKFYADKCTYPGSAGAAAPCGADWTNINTAQNNLSCDQNGMPSPGGAACTADQQRMASAYKTVTADQAKINADNAKIASDQTKLTLDQQSGQRSLNQAQNSITNAQDSLNTQSTQRPATIQAQQAAVESAQAAVTTAQNNLNGTTLTAPMDGVVTAVNGSAGDVAAAYNSSTVS